MTVPYTYSIGHPGTPWGAEEKAQWLAQQTIQRSYNLDVVKALEGFKQDFDVIQYSTLEYDHASYPVYAVMSRELDKSKPTVLVTGGVHGYETSGVHGALRFIQTQAAKYVSQLNIIVAPCISPWGYETINRWNPRAVDPNRSFVADSPAPESAAIMHYVKSLGIDLIAHIDLHETTDTDNSEFRPALSARDGIEQKNWNIPDGFYLVGDSENPVPEFQKAVLNEVTKITHIAEADEQGRLIGELLAQPGVINYATKQLGLCAGFTNAEYVTTTEVYPDSANATAEQCIQAQVAAVIGGLDFIVANTGS